MAATKVIWAPQPGSQQLFLSCPLPEVLYHGTRGPGKTDALLMDFAQHVGKGHGRSWRGVVFREEAVQLTDIINKSLKWFPQIFKDAVYLSGGDRKWRFADGEELLFRHIRRAEDYWAYHGHEYPWVGFEELTNWPTDECYQALKSVNRSSDPNVPRKYRATCNPFGAGHHWVKRYFIDPAPSGTPIYDDSGRARVALFGSITENKILMAADPAYYQSLTSLTDKAKRKAWLEGSWDIVAGGILEGAFEPEFNVLPPFKIPASWRVNRSFDYGSSKPYAVCWWAESDGSMVEVEFGKTRTFPKGSIFLINELYGWNGNPNTGTRETNRQIAQKILEAEAGIVQTQLEKGGKIWPGPADSAIFDVMNGDSYADEMARHGVRWEKSFKGPGSRVQGWDRLRQMLMAGHSNPLEHPGLFIFNTCRQWIRTVPLLPRDPQKADDVDTDAEDHIGDATRYRLLTKPPQVMTITNLPRVR